MLRVRPQHWKEVLPGFQLGWAEGSREACLGNLSSLSSVARALTASGKGPAKPADVAREADRLYGAHSFCPDGGKYEVSPDGRTVRCSLHGTATEPRQLEAPSASSPIGQRAQAIRRPDGPTNVPRRRPARGGDDPTEVTRFVL